MGMFLGFVFIVMGVPLVLMILDFPPPSELYEPYRYRQWQERERVREQVRQERKKKNETD